MSNGQEPKTSQIRVQEYLQFTPLASAVPVNSLIDTITLPRAQVNLPPLKDHLEPLDTDDTEKAALSGTPEARVEILRRIVDKAVAMDGQL